VVRPRLNIDGHRHELAALFQEGLSFDELARHLRDEYGLNVNLRTLKRRFNNWSIRKREATVVSDDLKRRIAALFFEVGLDDQEMLIALKDEGYQLGKYALVRLRFELNLRRSLRTEEQRRQADTTIRQLIAEEMEKGVIDGYGCKYLYTHFRQQGFIAARDRLFKIYRSLNFEAVERRKRDLQRRRGEYIVPGPDWIWSVDGYNKLKPYGIEIYACIDAYARYIVWIYVGISNATAVSCVRQYLDAIECQQRQPRYIRSDRGTETVMLANAHYQLQQNQQPSLDFSDCYIYGTSTANQRIEAWWQQMSRGSLFRWRVCLLLSTCPAIAITN
jgi:hypothetical protein